MAIDKIIVEFQAETTKLKKELDDLKGRLGNVETAAKDAGKNTGKAFNDAGKNANGLKDTIKNLGQQIAAAFAAREIIRFTKQTIDAASDLNETLSKSQQIFGDASKAVEDFASNSAKQFGQSKQQAIDAAASFGVFGKAAGLTGEDLSTFSTDLVALSADLASFGNTTPEEAALALGAALRGEAEPIRRFGVLLDDATLKQEALAMGLIETTKGALTPQQKVLAANAVILKQTADAQGDFARTSDGVANQQRILEASFKDLQTEIGQKLLPTFNSALTSLNEFLGDLDAEDVMSFAKAIAVAATAFGAFKLGTLMKDMGGLTGILKATTGGVQGLSKAVAANPFGLIASAIAVLVAYGPQIYDMFSGVTELQNDIAEASDKATENLRKEQAELNLVAEALKNTNPGSEQRAKLLQRFNELSPVAIKDLKDEAKFNEQLNSSLKKANESFALRIKLRGAEAAASVASQKQIDVQAKIIETEQKLLMEGFTETQIKARQGSGALSRFTQIALTLGGQGAAAAAMNEFTELIRLDDQFDEASKSLQVYTNLATEAKNQADKNTASISSQAAATKESTDATAANTDKTKVDTKAKEIAKTAVEKLNEELGKLKTAQENATFAGDIEKASEYQKAISKLENQLAIFKNTLEEVRGGIVGDEDLEALEIESNLSLSAGVDAIIAAELSKLKEDLGTFTDEDPIELPVILTIQEKAKQDALKKVGEIESKMGEVFGAVNSVLGPAMDALNGYFDLQLNNLEKEKNQRLANENLTAEERLRIEEEYEAKKNEILAEQFEVGRASQIINATMSAAQAALNAFAATAAIPLIGPGVAAAAAAVAGAFGALQIGIIAAQPNPYKFFEGTPYLQLGGNPKGKDTIPVMAHEGEAIIPTGKNLQYPGLAKSWIDGSLDGYINKNFVRPALMEQQRQAEEDFADRLAASMALQMSSNFDDYRLFRATKEQTAVLRDGFQTMKQTRKKLRGA
jgi:hypothetical protein